MRFANCYLLLLLLRCFTAYGQSLPIRPYNIKGLPQKSIIRAIHQDKQGFLWFGGLSGLYRYDGNLLQRFQHKANDSTSIPHNFITDFCEDENGDLVCGTLGGGMFVFNKRQEKIVSIKGLDVIAEGKSGLVTRIERSGFGSAVWCGTSIGTLIKYDPVKKYCERIFSNNPDMNSALLRGISGILELEKNKILLATLRGLYLVDADKKTSMPASKVYPSLGMLDSTETHSLLKDKQGRIFVGYKGGLLIVNTNASFAPASLQINEVAKLLNNKPVKDLIQLDDDNILIASTDLLLLYNTKTNEITDAGGGSPKQINQFYRDNNSNLWVTTEGLGLYFLNKDFSYFKTVPGLKTLSQGKKVEAIVEDDAGNWWIGTDNGLSIYVPGSEKPLPVLLNGKNLHVVSIFQDNRKGIWVGTQANGVFYFNDISARSPARNISTVVINGKLQALSNITSINEDKFGKIWFGSFNNSVFVYDPVQNKCWRPGNNSQVIVAVSKIIKDKSGVMWVSTWNDGFNKFDQSGDDPVNGKFVNYTVSKDTNSLSFHVTSCIMEDSKGNLWIGTVSGGLNKFDRQKNKFTKYTIENGLPSNLIYQVQEDKNNNLWISTDEGLVMLSENGVPISYREEDGLSTRSFNFLASFATNSGILGFGTIDGDLIFFNPSAGNTNIIKPSIVDLKLFNLTPDAATQTIYTAPVYSADKFRLKHDQSVLTFEFTNFDLVNSENYTFAYKLDGIDNNWNYISNRKSATYTSLPPGDYQLHLKAANHLGVWSENESVYKITVLPPWWKTWWAYLLYGVLIIVAITGFIRYRSGKLIKENMILEQKVSGRTVELNKTIDNLKATQAQLVQSEKMASLGELTAGIAHEIQNPLNFVNNFSEVNEELLKELKTEAEKGNLEEVKAIANDIAFNSEKINHHGKRADSIVKGMLQHSRNSTGQKEQTDINALADEYLRLAYHGLRAKDKTFTATTKTDFDNSVGKINVVPQEIGRVILNLINNAFYAVSEKQKMNSKGYEPIVTVTTAKQNGRIEIKVKDNGSGIPQKVLDKIFQPFFTTKPTGQGTGLGLSLAYDIITKGHGGELKVETEEGEGSAFSMYLPAN